MNAYNLFIQYNPNPPGPAPVHVNPIQVSALDDAEAGRQAEAVASFLMSGVASRLIIRVLGANPGQPIATITRP